MIDLEDIRQDIFDIKTVPKVLYVYRGDTFEVDLDLNISSSELNSVVLNCDGLPEATPLTLLETTATSSKWRLLLNKTQTLILAPKNHNFTITIVRTDGTELTLYKGIMTVNNRVYSNYSNNYYIAALLKQTAPTVSDNDYLVGTMWVNILTDRVYFLTSVVNNEANWIEYSDIVDKLNIQITDLQTNKVPKTTKIIGLDLQDDILLTEFKTALGNATQSVAGLLSAEDKTHLDSLVALLESSDGNTVVDTIGEILEIFQNYPEGADLVTVLNGKIDKTGQIYSDRNMLIVDLLTDFYNWLVEEELLNTNEVSKHDFIYGEDYPKFNGVFAKYDTNIEERNSYFKHFYTVNVRGYNPSKNTFLNQLEYTKWIPFIDLLDRYCNYGIDIDGNPQTFWGSKYIGIRRIKDFFNQDSNYTGLTPAQEVEISKLLNAIPNSLYNFNSILVREDLLDKTQEPKLVTGKNLDFILSAILQDYLQQEDLEGYVVEEDLIDYITNQGLTNILKDYVTKPEIYKEPDLEYPMFETKEDMINEFLDDFYNFLGLTSSINDFKHGVGNVSGFDGTWYSVYNSSIFKANTPTNDDTVFLTHNLYEHKWKPFTVFIDNFIKITQPTSGFWESQYVSNLRIKQYFTNVKPSAAYTNEDMAAIPAEYEYVETELEYRFHTKEESIDLLDNKLDKDFSALPTQASPLLTDVLAINRGTVAQKTTLEKLLALLDLSNFYNKPEVNGLLSAKVDKNNAITAGTKTKITYDSKGLVTSGADLEESDIPTLSASKITQDANNRFVTDVEKSTWNGKQNALTAGDGISISGNVISADGGLEEAPIDDKLYGRKNGSWSEVDSGLAVETWNTATKILALSDSNKLFKCSHTDNQTLTIPTNEDIAFPIGTMITFLLTSTYTVTFVCASGVTLTSMDSLVALTKQFGTAKLTKTDTNAWHLEGTLDNAPEPEPTGENYVRFVSAEARTITPKYTNSGVTLQYSVDSGATWTTIASESETTSATEHWFRGQATETKSLFSSNTATNAWAFSGSSDLEVYGNLNFLLCDTLGDEEAPTSLGSYAYAWMFRSCTSLTIAPELPATTLADGCYAYMFYNCTALTTAPELPATILAYECYIGMFYSCTSLTIAPELPATTLANNCYFSMFRSCSSLTTAPDLPATTLETACYDHMFHSCTSLTIAPELPATTLADRCYNAMFHSCTALTTASKLPATKMESSCYYTMFYNCTSLTTVPELPATTLAYECYRHMFNGCTSFKVSETNTGTYTYAWRIPTSGTGTTATSWNEFMLTDTSGTFTDDPTINTIYYVENEPV